METPGWALYINNDGVVDHTVHSRGSNDRVSEVVAEFFEVDVGGDDCRSPAVTAIDDFMEEIGISGVILFESVETHFVDQQDFRREEGFEF